jgi:HEAT repeat protein
LFLIGVLAGLVFWRRREAGGWEEVENGGAVPIDSSLADPAAIAAIVGDRREANRRAGARPGGRRSKDKKAMMRGPSQFVEPNDREQQLRSPLTTAEPEMLFGAYRIDQEVGKLVLRQPHRMDVLASRNVDDRRAMEASLLKSLRAPGISENGRRKARRALEDYGFVARQSAALLLGKDACERVAAARMLGEVGLSSSLQFLLEALYDVDAAVRNQAVESIGALKLPAAIGALLDIARRYPDVSSAVLSNALNACSIDTLEFDDSSSAQSALLLTNGGEPFNSEITHLEPSPTFQRLPESSEDELLGDTLAALQSDNADTRATAAQTLALYRVQCSVAALKQVASNDSEAAVRAVAVASLGAIDHESVFSAVLVALADEARDVRAAAARAVSRLSFDRADAYARVIEMSDEHELNEVACACIKTGMAAQALDRLSSNDRRQAYEAFSLLSLLAKANHYQPILDVIKAHADIASCKIAIQLLGFSGQPEIAEQLRQLAVRDEMPDALRALLVEVVNKIDKMQLA